MKTKKPGRLLIAVMAAVFLLTMPLAAGAADDFHLYDGQTAAEVTTNSLPAVEGNPYSGPSWFTAAEYVPAGTYAGQIIAVTGRSIYLEDAPEAGTYTKAANIDSAGTDAYMDPSFVRVSPDGSRIALGIGYGAPLLVFPTSTLAAGSPPGPDLLTDPSVTTYSSVNYYDADWAQDNRHLVINGGNWPGPNYASAVGVLDTDNPSDPGAGLIGNIGGASAGICVDNSGNLFTGIGYATNPTNRTGEIKVWNSTEWSTTPAEALDYELNARVLANNILSAAYLSTDAEGNLTVGGGDAFGVGGPSERGYAALVNANKVQAVASDPTPGTEPPVDENDPTEYKSFAPDPCQNDSAVGILPGSIPGQDGVMSVMWNPTNTSCNIGGADDYWPPAPGFSPQLTHYQVNPANDMDTDGFVDIADASYLTTHADNRDTDGDGYGNIVDADLNNDDVVNALDFTQFKSQWGQTGPDLDADLNGDSVVNALDFTIFKSFWGTQAPWF